MTRTPFDYFQSQYRADDDPWGFDRRWYERRKQALTLAALPDETYHQAFEPGCANGALTTQLAARCDRLLACDQVPEVVDRARARLSIYPNVTIDQRTIPDEWPEGPFDLVLLSELAYYFDGPDWDALQSACTRTLAAGSVLVAVHWRGRTDYPLSGAEAHQRLACGPWMAVGHYEQPEFLLDVWRRS